MEALLDQAAIAQLAAAWGVYRDNERWDRLRAIYAPDGVMRTTWFEGPASRFVDLCMEAARRGGRSRHFIGATTAEVRGDRAVSDTCMAIMVRGAVAGTAVDVTCQGRFHDRLVRLDGAWRIQYRVPVYDRDRLDPVIPGAAIALDEAALARYPEGFRFLAYVQSLTGATLPAGLPTAHSPEEAALCAESAAWLAAGQPAK